MQPATRVLPGLVASVLLSGCYTVDSFVDGPDADPGDGVCARVASPADVAGGVTNLCNLRAAVMEANALGVKATIFVPAGTHVLDLPTVDGGGRLRINASMRVQGSGAAATIVEQTVIDAVIHVQGGDDVEINHLTVRGGNSAAGGGLRLAAGTIELEDLVVRDNEAVTGGAGIAIDPPAVVRMRRSTVRNNMAIGAFGGGIWNTGELWVYDSTISHNDSNRAGGIRNTGQMNLRNVTVSGNTVHSPSAGTGGISQNGFAVLNNVTITDNTGRGNEAGSFRGGGIQTSNGRLTVMKNSIVAGNHGDGGPADCVGALTADSKHNLIGDTTGCTIPSFVWTYRLNVAANLGPLADHGGPTETHVPLSPSLALDAGYGFVPPAIDACEGRDQRGVPRPQGTGACDMGAVEFTPAGSFVTGFMLVDAATNTDLQPLRNDDVLRLDTLPPSLAIRAVVSGGPGSVVFDWAGVTAFRTENVAPYALGGDTAADYAEVAIEPGEHVLTATPYAGGGGAGAAGGALTIRFDAYRVDP